VVDDRLVHLVAADAKRLRDDDAAERDDRDLGRAAADIDAWGALIRSSLQIDRFRSRG
jgi:hypothetical protein